MFLSVLNRFSRWERTINQSFSAGNRVLIDKRPNQRTIKGISKPVPGLPGPEFLISQNIWNGIFLIHKFHSVNYSIPIFLKIFVSAGEL